MKQQLEILFEKALNDLKNSGVIPVEHEVRLMFERTKQKEHGDFATNVALTLAKAAKKPPRELAELLIKSLPESEIISKVELAGPGFINLFLISESRTQVVTAVLEQGEQYGFAKQNSKEKVMVEFVSANPTGPLHVGHGRGAAYGDALARLLTAAGYQVEKEYYVNDAGRQMDILATSLWLRYLQANSIELNFPKNGYQGDYILEMAAQIASENGDKYNVQQQEINAVSYDKSLLKEAAEETDKEKQIAELQIDALIAFAKTALQENDGYQFFFDRVLGKILDDIRLDLHEFGIDFTTWFSEKSLFTSGKIDAAIESLKSSGHLYLKNGAWCLKVLEYGEEKDRVVVRENGQPTYFASDIAYHKDKFDRGFETVINVLGADHHGYIPRLNTVLNALGYDANKLKIQLVQFAVLYRSGEKIPMSTRSGKFVTLRELRQEVGSDAARFFYVQRKSEQHMDFDLDQAKLKSNENPMYYVQYAHARICSIFEQAKTRSIDIEDLSKSDLSLLASDSENALMTLLQKFPEVVESASKVYEPHQLTNYLKDLAMAFHSYYNTSKFLELAPENRLAVFSLIKAVKQVLGNGLSIIGVSAPIKM